MRLFPESEKKTVPSRGTTTPAGASTWAFDAGPPSPEKPWSAVPATVEIVPAGLMTRRRLLPVSAT